MALGITSNVVYNIHGVHVVYYTCTCSLDSVFIYSGLVALFRGDFPKQYNVI